MYPIRMNKREDIVTRDDLLLEYEDLLRQAGLPSTSELDQTADFLEEQVVEGGSVSDEPYERWEYFDVYGVLCAIHSSVEAAFGGADDYYGEKLIVGDLKGSFEDREEHAIIPMKHVHELRERMRGVIKDHSMDS